MDICKVCGANLHGEPVCPCCGTPAGQIVTNASNVSVMDGVPKSIREKSLDTLDEIICYYLDVEPDYDLYFKETDELAKRKSKKPLAWLFAAPIFTIICAAIVTAIPALNYFVGNSGFFGILIAIAALILPVIIPIYLKVKNAKEIKRLDVESKNQIDKVMNYFYSYGKEMPISFEYFNRTSLSELRYMIYSGRANTISQAINLMLDDKHKRILEENTAIAALNSQIAAAYSKKAAKAAAKAESYAEGAYFNSL